MSDVETVIEKCLRISEEVTQAERDRAFEELLRREEIRQKESSGEAVPY